MKTNFYILLPTELGKGELSYDMAYGFVIEARSLGHARKLANKESGRGYMTDNFWRDPSMATCKLLKRTGESKIILRKFLEG